MGFPNSFMLEFIALIIAMVMNFFGGRVWYNMIDKIPQWMSGTEIYIYIYIKKEL